jgi:hypothetical protein
VTVEVWDLMAKDVVWTITRSTDGDRHWTEGQGHVWDMAMLESRGSDVSAIKNKNYLARWKLASS